MAAAAIFVYWPLEEDTSAHAQMVLHYQLTERLAAEVINKYYCRILSHLPGHNCQDCHDCLFHRNRQFLMFDNAYIYIYTDILFLPICRVGILYETSCPFQALSVLGSLSTF